MDLRAPEIAPRTCCSKISLRPTGRVDRRPADGRKTRRLLTAPAVPLYGSGMGSRCRRAMALLLVAGSIGATSAFALPRSPFVAARDVVAPAGEQLAYCARSAARAPREWKNKTWKGATWKGTTWKNKGWRGKGWQVKESKPKEWKSVARIKAESR
jgi:hypothetical protein